MIEVLGFVRKADVEKLMGAELPTVKNYLEVGTWDQDWHPDSAAEMRAILQRYDMRMRKLKVHAIGGFVVSCAAFLLLIRFAVMLFG